MNIAVRSTVLALLIQWGAFALPESPQVQHGQIDINSAGNILQILQSSPQGIINWSTFNISPNEIVRFLQPGNGITLNRVVGGQGSLIEGLLQANGTIFLINPNGIIFSPGAQINAGSFLASTLDMSNADFLNGKYQLQQDPSKPLTALVNQGRIEIGEGGYTVLVAPLVHNEGLIIANQGHVAIGASTQATVSFDAQGLLQFTLPDGWRGQHADPGGTVLLTPGQLTDTLSGVLGLSPGAQATALPNRSGIVSNTGTIDVSGAQGGSIFVDSALATAHLEAGSLRADASAQGGQGGRIDLLSAGTTTASGSLSARGGDRGVGGFVEVSGSRPNLWVAPDVSAAQGVGGTILLDPQTLNIVHAAPGDLDIFLPTVAAGDGGAVGSVSIAALEAVASGTIQLQASGSIHWVDAVKPTIELKPGVNLTMDAGDQVLADPKLSIHAVSGNITILAVNNIQSPGVVAVDGDVFIASATGRVTLAGDVAATGSGSVELESPGGVLFTADHQITGGAGVHIEAYQLLGSTGQAGDARIDTPGQLTLEIEGPNNAAAAAAARVTGTLGNSYTLTSSADTGAVFINGLWVNGPAASAESGGESHDGLERSTEELHQIGLESTAQQNVSLGNDETYYELSPGDSEHLPVSNLSLSSSNLIPIYTLNLVGILNQDNEDQYWRNFLERFIIWEDSPDEAEP